MDLVTFNWFLNLWICVSFFSIFLDPTEATILKRIRERKEKDSQAAASAASSQYSAANSNKGYGQGHGHGHGHRGPGGPNHGGGGYDPDYDDGYREDYPSNNHGQGQGYGHRDRGPNSDHGHGGGGHGQGGYQGDYRGEPSHTPNRYAGSHYGSGGGGSRGGLGGDGGPGFNNRNYGHGGRPDGYQHTPNGYNEDYYDGPAEDHSGGYGAIHQPNQNPGGIGGAGGGNGNFDRPPYGNGNPGYEEGKQFVDDYGDEDYNNGPPPPLYGHPNHNNRPPTNFNLPNGPGPAGPHKHKPGSNTFNENENIPEVIITEKRPLSASDLENGSLTASGSSKRGIVERIRKWRNDHKNSGKNSDGGIR